MQLAKRTLGVHETFCTQYSKRPFHLLEVQVDKAIVQELALLYARLVEAVNRNTVRRRRLRGVVKNHLC